MFQLFLSCSPSWRSIENCKDGLLVLWNPIEGCGAGKIKQIHRSRNNKVLWQTYSEPQESHRKSTNNNTTLSGKWGAHLTRYIKANGEGSNPEQWWWYNDEKDLRMKKKEKTHGVFDGRLSSRSLSFLYNPPHIKGRQKKTDLLV